MTTTTVPSEQEAIDHVVTVLETSPRHSWRKILIRMTNNLEADFSKNINQTVTNNLTQTAKDFEKRLDELLIEMKITFNDFTNREKTMLEEQLDGHRFSEKLVKHFMELSIEENRYAEKTMRSKSMELEHRHIADIRDGFKRLYKEKWQPAKASNEFISSALEMKHGGEVVPHLKKYTAELQRMSNDLSSTMAKFVEELRKELRHEQKMKREEVKNARPSSTASP